MLKTVVELNRKSGGKPLHSEFEEVDTAANSAQYVKELEMKKSSSVRSCPFPHAEDGKLL
jgi:hypothetical protein